MLKNYIKIAIRNLVRNRVYSIINILGLTLGITCASFLFLLVMDELSFDTMYSKSDRIYRVVEIDNSEGETRYYGQTAPPVGPTIAEENAEIEGYARLYQFGGHINFALDNTRYHERSYFYAEKDLFNLFDFEWVAGNKEKALAQGNSMVIDLEWAKTLFGNDNPIGKFLDSGGEEPFEVTGVFKNTPQNSHLQARVFVALPTTSENVKNYLNNWSEYGAYTYIVLDENANFDQLDGKMANFNSNHFEPEQQREIYLQPLKEIHFNSQNIEYGTESVKGEKAYVYVFIAIGLFMLIIACINYMNLATAKSVQRSREIGIRKVSGAIRGQLIAQFLSESVVIAIFAAIISIGLIDLLLPFFNEFTGKSFVFDQKTFGQIAMLVVSVTVFVGLLSGFYPALVLSALKPSHILKGSNESLSGSGFMRKVLVITQFSLSIIMIIATVITSSQLTFIQNASLGFNNDQILVIDINNGDVRRRFETIRSEFGNSPYVKDVAVSSRVPGEWKNIREVYYKQLGGQDSVKVSFLGFDENMIDLYEMKMVSGENFTGNTSADSLKIIINETMAESLNTEDPVGSYIELLGRNGAGQYQIVGIVKDFNFQSLHNTIGPVILGYQSNGFQSIDYFSLKFDPNHIDEVIRHATSVHNTFDLNSPIEYHFLDQQWAEFYKQDTELAGIFTLGAGITIFIACLGLFGLASFVVQKRMKEISIRKVLGASESNLFILLTKSFLGQLIIAFVIAAPLAYYLMEYWLSNFAYKMTIGIQHFLIAGGSAMAIALLTISYRLIKASVVNPAETLKNE